MNEFNTAVHAKVATLGRKIVQGHQQDKTDTAAYAKWVRQFELLQEYLEVDKQQG